MKTVKTAHRIISMAVVFVLIVLIGIIMTLPLIHKTRVGVGPVQILSSKESFYVFVQTWNVHWQGSLLDLIRSRIGGWMMPRNTRDNFMLYVVKGGSQGVDVINFKIPKCVGYAFCDRGLVYFLAGSGPATYPELYTLDESGITGVERAEALKVLSTFRFVGEKLKQEGWDSDEIVVRRQHRRIPIGQWPYFLESYDGGESSGVSVAIRSSSNNAAVLELRVLMEIPNQKPD